MCALPVNGTRWCSHIDHSSMSRTRIISSWPMSKVVVSTSSGVIRRPDVSSAYALATRAGVSRSPSRVGSSPIAASSSRTAASARAWSNAGTSPGARSTIPIGSVMRAASPGREVGAGTGADPRVTVDVATRAGRGDDGARARVGGGPVGGRAVADLLGHLDRRELGGVAERGPGPRRTLRPATQRLEDARHLLLVEGLLVEELEHEVVEDVAVLLEDVEGLLVGVRQEPLRLLVDDRGDLLGVVALVAEVAPQERLGVGL